MWDGSHLGDNMKKNKHERAGWSWVEVNESSGYWIKNDQEARHSHKLDLFCAHCGRITGTIDDKYLKEWGFCSKCFTLYVEGRKEPIIDVEKYKKMIKKQEE